jgi:hypothetical protein
LTINKNSVTFMVSIENKGDVPAILSDDLFKNKCELPAGKTAVKPVTLQMQNKKTDRTLAELIETDPLELPYRVVYYSDEMKKDYLSIETQVKIFRSDVTITG